MGNDEVFGFLLDTKLKEIVATKSSLNCYFYACVQTSTAESRGSLRYVAYLFYLVYCGKIYLLFGFSLSHNIASFNFDRVSYCTFSN